MPVPLDHKVGSVVESRPSELFPVLSLEETKRRLGRGSGDPVGFEIGRRFECQAPRKFVFERDSRFRRLRRWRWLPTFRAVQHSPLKVNCSFLLRRSAAPSALRRPAWANPNQNEISTACRSAFSRRSALYLWRFVGSPQGSSFPGGGGYKPLHVREWFSPAGTDVRAHSPPRVSRSGRGSAPAASAAA